jgi:putative Mg2+ transporter-C (MgtC) family protein
VPSEWELALRLLLAAGLAGLLGMERELTDQPAGFRTHILVGLGAALFAIISAFGFQSIAGEGPTAVVRADITRVASQIVVGIGFLGGGAIVKYGATVRGLTTAASLWITAAIGTAIGIGLLVLGGAATAVAIVAIVGLRPLRRLLRRRTSERERFVVTGDEELDPAALISAVRERGASLREIRVESDDQSQTISIEVRTPGDIVPEDIAADLGRSPHVLAVDWNGK